MGGVIGRYYLYQAAANATFFSPVFVVFYAERVGLPLSTVLGVQSACLLLRASLDVPFGALADRWSRRGCLAAAAILQGLGAAALVAWPTLAVVWGAELAFAVSAALRSGADSALLFDTLRAADRLEAYPRAESRGQAMAAASSGVAGIIGGLLASGDLGRPYVATSLSAIVWMCVAWMLPAAIDRPGRVRPPLVVAARAAAMQRPVWWAIAFATWAVVGSHVYFYLQQPFLHGLGVPVAWFGVVFASTKAMTALVATAAHRLDDRIGPRGVVAVMMASVTFGLGAMSVVTTPIAALVLLTRGLLDGLWQPLTNVYMNRLVGSDVRATMLSLQNVIARGALGLVVGVTGLATAEAGLMTTLGSTAALLCLVGVGVLLTVPPAVLAGAGTCGSTRA